MLKTGRLNENAHCIPERKAKKSLRKQYRKDKKIKVPIQKMNKQIRVLERQNKGKKEGKGGEKKNQITFKGPIIKWLYTSQKQYQKLQKKGALFFKFSKNMKQNFMPKLSNVTETLSDIQELKKLISHVPSLGEML